MHIIRRIEASSAYGHGLRAFLAFGLASVAFVGAYADVTKASLTRVVGDGGVIVLYGTLPGGEAADCADAKCDSGPVSASLRSPLSEPGISPAKLFDRANEALKQATSGRQSLSLFASQDIDAPIVDADGTKKAIVVANGAYAKLPWLAGTKGDATIIADSLRGQAFDVVVNVDKGLDTLIRDIENATKDGNGRGTMIVYYSGHGFSTERGRYLPLLDAQLDNDELATQSIDIETLISAMSQANVKRKLLIVDTHFPRVPKTSTR